ncbi:MAG: hypothetical protein Q8881_03925 [Sweet potato little leaf phytoplasma]|nr:hypothetical protein [Sweet potato little leaf phytoplasma]
MLSIDHSSAEFRTRGCFPRNGRIFVKFRPRGRFPREGRISAEFRTRGNFPRNGRIFAQSIPPNFALGMILTKRPNFCPISHSGAFPPKRPNQSRRISVEFCTRDVSAKTAESILPNFRRISHSRTFRRNGRTSAKFHPRGCFPRDGRISAEFRTRGRFPRNG